MIWLGKATEKQESHEICTLRDIMQRHVVISQKSTDLINIAAEVKSRKPWITHEMINKTDERKKWKNVNNEERRTTDD
jgi:hypothetical protein